MIPLRLTMNLEIDPWDDLTRDDITPATIERVGILPNATDAGRACVEFLCRTEDGRVIVAETTLRLFLMAARVVQSAPVTSLEEL